MSQIILKLLLSNMAWIEEVYPNGEARWATMKGILEGLTRVDEQSNDAESGTCPVCNGNRVVNVGESKILCPKCTVTGHV